MSSLMVLLLQCQALCYYNVKPYGITMLSHMVLQCQALWYNNVKSYGITMSSLIV